MGGKRSMVGKRRKRSMVGKGRKRKRSMVGKGGKRVGEWELWERPGDHKGG